MIRFFFVFALCALASFSESANAASLINESACPVLDEGSQHFYVARASGIRCEDWQSISKATRYASLILAPASFAALKNPAIGAELAAMGLTLANPAVLSVAVVGVFGVTTFNIILNASLEECDRMEKAELRETLMRELETKYGLSAVQSETPLEVER